MIEVQDLVKNYGDVKALKGVSFSVEKGEIIGFLGPNGAGKTTAMKIITCYLAATSGSVTIAGCDVVSQSYQVRQKLGYLPENAPLYPDMNVVDYLRFIAGVRGLTPSQFRERAQQIITDTGLSGVLSKSIGQLSKGYRQRVGLAQALIHHPEILILDEPTNGLDPNQIVEIRQLIKQIGREKTVILCSHILSEVTVTCSRVIIIADGRLVASGTPEELARSGAQGARIHARIRGPREAVQAALRGSARVAEARAVSEEGGLSRWEITARGEGDPSEEIFQTVAQHGWSLAELRSEGASLEEIFKRLTTGEGT